MQHSPIIQARGLKVWYGDLQSLKGVDMDIGERRVTALIGASGSGKSTFLRSLNRMLDTIPSVRVEGSIRMRNLDVLADDTDVIELRRSVGMVFQNPTPFPKSIFDNVAYGLEIQGVKRPRGKGAFGWMRRASAEELEGSRHPLEEAVTRSLKEAALWDEVKDRVHKSAFGLSGGQQQRLCIARAIAVRPSVLLLDEPCSELDPISTHKIEELLVRLKKEYTIVIVTHNLHQARRISDDVGFFHGGQLVEFGSAADVFERPRESLTAKYVRGEFG